MKNRLLCVLFAVVLCVSVFMTGCSLFEPAEPSDDENMTLDEYIASFEDELKDVKPEGEITEIWFEKAFDAFYPKQLKDIYFTKTYMYGDEETEQPVIGMCSEKLTEIKLCSFDGNTVGEELFAVEELSPMEALVLRVVLSETPELAITFKDEAGAAHTCTVARNADDSMVIVTELAE